MSIKDDLKNFGKALGGKKKAVAKKMSDPSKGWYAQELMKNSKAGIDKKKRSK